MPSKWSVIDNSFPTFTGQETARMQITALTNYMYLLVEQMKYNLENLDTTNWNTKALTQFQSDTTKDVKKGLQTVTTDLTNTASDLMALTQSVASITARINALEDLSGRMSQAETDIAYLEREADETRQSLEDLEKDVANAQADIDELMTMFQRTEDGAVIGAEGQTIRLVGNVYINGKLME